MNRIMAPALIALMLTGTGFIIKTHQERTGAEKRKKHEIFLGSLNKQAPLLKKEGGREEPGADEPGMADCTAERNIPAVR